MPENIEMRYTKNVNSYDFDSLIWDIWKHFIFVLSIVLKNQVEKNLLCGKWKYLPSQNYIIKKKIFFKNESKMHFEKYKSRMCYHYVLINQNSKAYIWDSSYMKLDKDYGFFKANQQNHNGKLWIHLRNH